MGEREVFYRRHLPHYQPEEATFHVVLKLAGSLPLTVIEEMRIEREIAKRLREPKNELERRLLQKLRWGYFKRFDSLLDGNSTGPHWLGQLKIAQLVKEAMHYRDGNVYDLLAYTIMPNHVHMVIELVRRVADPTKASRRDTVPSNGLTDILASLKKYTALKANRILHRSGAFWQSESYDHVIRDDAELERTISYVLQNPVQARLARSWEQWPFNYCKWDLR